MKTINLLFVSFTYEGQKIKYNRGVYGATAPGLIVISAKRMVTFCILSQI